ncbi:hypothetical protein [Enterococcus sp. AZ196]|uniref:hypothetical protein n=1 Tax=Enterococcus sp. AZ196 TaxID=2774659 RepID=UPI003D264E6A
MSGNQELLAKKVIFLMDKYLFPKQRIAYLVKGFSGMIVFWIYEFLSVFGGIANYKKMLADSLNQTSEQLRSQLESPMFMTGVLLFIIFSFIIGYLIVSFGQLIVDLLRRQVYKDFDKNKLL